jgi:hypothetical protein
VTPTWIQPPAALTSGTFTVVSRLTVVSSYAGCSSTQVGWVNCTQNSLFESGNNVELATTWQLDSLPGFNLTVQGVFNCSCDGHWDAADALYNNDCDGGADCSATCKCDQPLFARTSPVSAQCACMYLCANNGTAPYWYGVLESCFKMR